MDDFVALYDSCSYLSHRLQKNSAFWTTCVVYFLKSKINY